MKVPGQTLDNVNRVEKSFYARGVWGVGHKGKGTIGASRWVESDES